MKNKYILLLVPAALLLFGNSTGVANASEIKVKSAGLISVKRVSYTANSVSNTYNDSNLDLLYSDSKEFTEDLGAVTNIYEITNETKENKIYDKNEFISEKKIKDDDSLKQKEEKIKIEKQKQADEKAKQKAEEAEKVEKQKQASEKAKQEAEEVEKQKQANEKAKQDTEKNSKKDEKVTESIKVQSTIPNNNDTSVVSIAEQYLGVPYQIGGTSPGGFDCSGLVQYVYAQMGIKIPRVTWDQSAASTIISVDEAQPGDLLFWGGVGAEYHVAIYAGNGQYIHSPQPGEVVTYGSISGFTPSHAGRVG